MMKNDLLLKVKNLFTVNPSPDGLPSPSSALRAKRHPCWMSSGGEGPGGRHYFFPTTIIFPQVVSILSKNSLRGGYSSMLKCSLLILTRQFA